MNHVFQKKKHFEVVYQIQTKKTEKSESYKCLYIINHFGSIGIIIGLFPS